MLDEKTDNLNSEKPKENCTAKLDCNYYNKRRLETLIYLDL